MAKANVWLGTSGFSYKEWKPLFYPEKLPQRQFLQYYASRLNSVEIDATFYRMPSAKMIDTWKAATPDGFRFALKASRQITHRERLRVPSDALQYLNRTVLGLGGRLGVLLYQLPPFFRCDPQKLAAFLSVLPTEIHAAVEFRHDSWFIKEVYELLRQHGVALCINDGDEQTTPLEITAGYTYIRLRRSNYDGTLCREWRDRIRAWAGNGIEVFAYIKHKDNPNAPQIAADFAEGLV